MPKIKNPEAINMYPRAIFIKKSTIPFSFLKKVSLILEPTKKKTTIIIAGIVQYIKNEKIPKRLILIPVKS